MTEIYIDDYQYALAESRIAKFPVEPRNESKLLVYRKGAISHKSFNNITKELPKNAHLVFNNTKVIPARLYFQKLTGAIIEIFLLNPIAPSTIISQTMEMTEEVQWQCMIGNKKKWKGEELLLKIPYKDAQIEIRAKLLNSKNNIVQINWNHSCSFAELLRLIGEIPLPPYLNRKTEKKDLLSYQTVYSKNDGAVAAPTAGLHFSKSIFEDLKKAQHNTSFITLHVGAGTFQPVKVENALEHHMHSEQMVFKKEFIDEMSRTENPIIPIGTTSMRSLESLYWFGVKLIKEKKVEDFFVEKLYPYQFEQESLPSKRESLKAVQSFMEKFDLNELIGDTEIFIFPGYTFKFCDGLITNFHQPKSTLLLLISALVGDCWKNIYQNALENNYRFLSYGDSSLLVP